MWDVEFCLDTQTVTFESTSVTDQTLSWHRISTLKKKSIIGLLY